MSNYPQIQLIPLKPSIPANQSTKLDILVKVIPPSGDSTVGRPRLNLSLVIDRSSSMSVKRRLEYAKAAARHAVQQLEEGDRISIVTFDRHVQIPVKSQPVENQAAMIQAIQGISVGKWTNLHAGWEEGGHQVLSHKADHMVNRVMVLTDGWPSVGITDSTMITNNVKALTTAGVSTTAIGVGDDYNEDLLGAIATSGNGNYHYISTPEDLPREFEREMQTLFKMVGQQVMLDIRPQDDITVDTVLNNLPVSSGGQFKLPNLVEGYPFLLVVRLNVPPLTGSTLPYHSGPESLPLCQLRLNWHSPGGIPQAVQKATLQLPVVPHEIYASQPAHPEVEQQVALLLTAQLKQDAMRAADQQDYSAAHNCLYKAKSIVRGAPTSPTLQLELIALQSLEADLGARQIKRFRKRSHQSAYQTQAGFDQTGFFGIE